MGIRKSSLIALVLTGLVFLIVSGFLGCGEKSSEMSTQRESQVIDQVDAIDFQEPVLIEASKIEPNMGQPKSEGTITITFTGFERVGSVEDQFTGEGVLYAQGKFVVVYYNVKNNLNYAIQPATQINDMLVIEDDQGRMWETIDYRPPLSAGITGDFAVSRGMSQPETQIDPGFTSSTAIAFDVPEDRDGRGSLDNFL